MAPTIGKKVAQFTAPSTQGEDFSLAAAKGKALVLYFYPKDATSGCTVEAQEFRAFRHAIDSGVSFVMSEHIAVPSITGGSDLPASVEKKPWIS